MKTTFPSVSPNFGQVISRTSITNGPVAQPIQGVVDNVDLKFGLNLKKTVKTLLAAGALAVALSGSASMARPVSAQCQDPNSAACAAALPSASVKTDGGTVF